MRNLLFSVIVGTLFVILGRWMYWRPEKVYPSWVPSRPDSSFYPKFVRMFARVVIFGGSYSVVAGIAGPLLPEPFIIIVAFAVGITGAWLLVPRSAAP